MNSTKFNEIYQKLINDKNKILPNIFDINTINEISIPKYKWFGIYEILNEYVENIELTPIPKQFFIDVCKNIKTKKFQILKYSYQKIANLLDNYQYEYADDFKNHLIKGGVLYIISSKYISDNLDNKQMNTIYNELLKTFNEEEIENIIYKISTDVSGLTSTLDDFNPIIFKNVFIFINQNRIINRSWSSTLEHEITHFIQRIVGPEKTFKRLKDIPGNSYQIYMNNKEFFDKIFANKVNKNVCEFIHYILKTKEQHESIKHILMEFQRYYERNNKEKSSFKDDILTKKQNINKRMIWLNNFLNSLNNVYFKSKNWEEKILLINKNWNELSNEQKIKYNLIHAILGYKIYEFMLPNLNIKNQLIKHFSMFKYRDN